MREQCVAERQTLAVPAELGEYVALAQPCFVEMFFERGVGGGVQAVDDLVGFCEVGLRLLQLRGL